MTAKSGQFADDFQRLFDKEFGGNPARVEARYTVLCGVSGAAYLGAGLLTAHQGFPANGLPTTLHAGLEMTFTIAFVILGLVRAERAVSRPVALSLDGAGVTSETPFGRRFIAWTNLDRIERVNQSLLCLGDTLSFHAKTGRGITMALNQIDTPLSDILKTVVSHRPDLIARKR